MANSSPIVLIPGWTKTGKDYTKLVALIKSGHRGVIYSLDLPGFGVIPLAKPYTLADYANYVTAFLAKKSLKKVILIGHSNGARIALKIAITRPKRVEKLVLIASAGIERGTMLTKLIALIKSAKIDRLVGGKTRNLLAHFIGSDDYKQTSTYALGETLKNLVKENLEGELYKIKIPALIIWGENDHTTPLWQGELMHKLIKGSTFKIIPDGDHGLPYRRPKEVAAIINHYLHVAKTS